MNLSDCIMIILLLTNLSLLASSRLGACIRIMTSQGIIIAFLPILAVSETHTAFSYYPYLLALVILTVKGILFPLLLKYTLRSVNVRREIEPFVGYGASIIIGVIVLIFSFWLCSQISVHAKMLAVSALPIAIFTIFCGLFVIVSRVKAVTQVIGYIVFENGIYVFGSALLIEQSFLVELGIILDVFVVIFIMGIMTFHINRAFDHIDTDRLEKK
jgi:hydrogenase-4 component E